MKPVTVISGRMAPLPMANVDTDQIIPKQFLKRIERSGYGPFLFYDWAHDEEGEPVPGFVLNRPEYAGAVVLVSGPNFGCGSSREHAPWSIQDRGFEAVIAPSFADIFFNNCVNIGLLPVVLPDGDVAALFDLAAAGTEVSIDLETTTVTAGPLARTFDIDPFARFRLLNGLDRIGLTMQHDQSIETFESTRPGFKPTVS